MSAPDEKVRIRIEAPASWDRLDIAQAVVGPDFLIKAERIKTGGHTWHRYRPMREAHDAEVLAYHELLLRMVEAIQTYVEQHVVEGRLGKSDSQWILIAPEHFDEIRKIIGDYHEAYVAGLLNPALLKPGELQRLIDEGIVAQDLKYITRPRAHEKPAESVRSILQAYEYGRDLAMEPHREAQTGLKNTSYDVWNASVKRPLSPAENEAVRWAERHAAQYVRGLGNKIADATGTIVVDHALRQKHEEEIRDAVTMNTWKRESWRKIITDITDKTGDYARDYGRIAATEKQRAMQEGTSRGLTKRFGSPKGIRVAKQPAPDACEHCVRLHLTAGAGSPPRIFMLSELTANGTNVGRKARDWQPVVGPVHPWCHGSSVEVTVPGGTRPIALLRNGDLVLTHKGRLRPVKRIAKRVHDGDLVIITCADRVLEVTPEHPYLTQRGWVAAADLKPLDQLMEIHNLPFVADEHADSEPPQSFEVFRLSEILCALSRGTVPVGVYLYGNEDRKQREVDIEWSYRELRGRLIAGSLQLYQDLTFVVRDVSIALTRLGRLDLLCDWARLATLCGMRFVYNSPSLLSVHTFPVESGSLPRTADFHAVLSQKAIDCLSTDIERSSNLRSAFTGDIRGSDRLDAKRHSDTVYCGVLVKSIRSKQHHGTVYALSVEEDESYVAGGVVVHNCGCELIHVPDGWGFDDDGNLVPESLKRADLLTRNLQKALSYSAIVPIDRVHVQVADPHVREIVERVVAETPPEVFTRGSGVTLITTDTDRVATPLNANDYAYWTENEIRLMQTIPLEKVDRVIRHEIGHSLNVWAANKLGSVAAVRAWHTRLWKVSQREGFVSAYARKEPIENAAEATRLYLYDRPRLMLRYPRTFAFLHRMYRDLIRGNHAHPEDRRDPPKA